MTGTTDLGRALHAWRDRTKPAEAGTKTVRHASVGELTLDCDILAALGTDLRIMVFSVEGSETADRLRLLEVVGVQRTHDRTTPSKNDADHAQGVPECA